MAKSSVVLDIAPWGEETDMAVIEQNVRGISQDGLHWGASQLVPVIGNVSKLQILAIIVDDLVSVDDVVEKIESDEDNVQSVDIVSFNKI